MIDFYKKYWRTAFDIALLLLTVYLFMAAFSYLFSIGTSIFIAFILYVIINPFAHFLKKRGVRNNIAVTISTFSFIAILLSIIIILGAVITSQVENLTKTIPKYTESIQTTFNQTVNYAQEKYEALPDSTVKSIKDNTDKYTEKAASFASGLLVSLFSFLSSIPKAIINFLVGLILAFFLSLEIDSWKKIAHEKTPKTFKLTFYFLKENVIKGLSGYIKAQLILILCTFVLVLIGFLVLGVKSAFVLAIVAAVLDLLPLLGVSSLFVPWIIYLFVVGNTALGIKLTVLLVVVLVFRQIMEPKITGDSLGVSAFTMLAAMILSLSIFGVAGLILSPVILILMKALIDQGYLRKWIRIPEDEFETTETSGKKE